MACPLHKKIVVENVFVRTRAVREILDSISTAQLMKISIAKYILLIERFE